MSQKIKINLINLNSSDILIGNNNNILISVNNKSLDLTTISENYSISYNLDNTLLNVNNFIYVENNIDINALKQTDFVLDLPILIRFTYGFYYSDIISSLLYKSIIIYPKNINVLFTFMGLPNLKNSIYLNILYKYALASLDNPLDINNYNGETNDNITLNNNYNGLVNYLNNKITFDGLIYKILIENIDNGEILPITYNLYNMSNVIYLNNNLNIYVYNNTYLFSWIENLNTYNFIYENKRLTNTNQSIVILIDYVQIQTGSEIYNKTDNLTNNVFYEYDGNGNQIQIISPINPNSYPSFTIVLSLNLQLYNYANPTNMLANRFYNTIFFYNYINTSSSTYFVQNISVFDNDYTKYFSNTPFPVTYNNIGSCANDLYLRIIDNDNNLNVPTIPNLNFEYFFVNIDSISLLNLIRFESENNYFYNFMNTITINFNTLVEYLYKYTLTSYSIYNIKNYHTTLFNETNLNIEYNIDNKLYNYTEISKLDYNNIIVNFNNNIMNSILCKITFFYSFFGSYTVDFKLFLDNYNIKLYNKNYDLSPNNKKLLIKLLLFLAANTYLLKLQFYNDKNSVISPSNIFNQLVLLKNNGDFKNFISIIGLDSTYTNANIEFNIDINLQYYILFLNTNFTFSNLSQYDELVFLVYNYCFKIFKIKGIHGDLNQTNNVYYIMFQNLKELNIFMNYVRFGIFDININSEIISDYFNFLSTESITFVNHYNINNLWIIDDITLPNIHKISFEISDLSINQIYLYGSLSIIEK